jgi:mannose-6-phosphate isomerase
MMSPNVPVLRFREHFVHRIWGGRRLEEYYGPVLPPEQAIGEAWLVSDHSSHESVVAEGPLQGMTLHELLEHDPAAILGAGAALTRHGRFPLLLKILDAHDDLSVQVHPDDETALRLGEPDVGKTEMWHVLRAEPGSVLVYGMHDTSRGHFAEAARNGTIETLLEQRVAQPGSSVFVPAGTVHAIRKGIVLAEIQQNSDLTYRIYDYGRLQDNGMPRELHLEKAQQAIDWQVAPASVAAPLDVVRKGSKSRILAACRYFAAEHVHVDGLFRRDTRGYSFHILLCVSGHVYVKAGGAASPLVAGQALMVPGVEHEFALDIVGPLTDAGHPVSAIGRLGGSGAGNDVLRALGAGA